MYFPRDDVCLNNLNTFFVDIDMTPKFIEALYLEIHLTFECYLCTDVLNSVYLSKFQIFS